MDIEEYRANLDDPYWRLTSGALYKIIIKGDNDEDSLVIPFVPNEAQLALMGNLHNRNLILKARQLGFCVAPETRVLTAELRWVQIAELTEGQELVAVDEHPPGGRGMARRMRTATVQAVSRVHRMAYRISFDDGRFVVCTDRHPWLSKKAGDMAEWRSLSGQGNSVVGRLKVGTSVRWVTKPWDAPTYEDGWFGGMLDGEGSISKSNSSAGINVSQREGAVWDRMVSYCESRGYKHCIESDKPERLSKHGKVPVPKIAFGRMDEMFRVIGQTRPSRFIGNRFWECRELPGKRNGDVGWSSITRIEQIGEQAMVDLQTSTGTYIAEGFVSHNTTLVAILWLDTVLFSKSPMRCGIIAQDREAAEVIFRDKVKFAYDNLPPLLKQAMPLERDSASELLFAHNSSSIRVATSMRSGTIHRLHVSEFGKICAKFPDKAVEVVTGSIPAVPKSGVLIVESTAEGQEGEFYEIAQRSKRLSEQGSTLTERDYRFHFSPWWKAPEYTLDPLHVIITEKDERYFSEVESVVGRKLSDGQRAWYVATRESDFSGDHAKMWQEYPSHPDEAFQVSTEGCYYAEQLTAVRAKGRICRVPELPQPVNTFWDIGQSDLTAIWFHQQLGPEHRFIRYYEASGEDLRHFIKYLQDTGYLWGRHYLPHDASHKRLSDTNRSTVEMLEGLGLANIEVVPRITDIMTGIQQTRAAFSVTWFDEAGCAPGLKRLQNYKKQWNSTIGAWRTEPMHDDNSNGADAFRQFAQALEGGLLRTASSGAAPRRRQGSWRTA